MRREDLWQTQDPNDHYDSGIAHSEGWTISQSSENGEVTWHIEGTDKVDPLGGSHSFVFWNAIGGNENCLNAIVFLLNNDLYELTDVLKHANVEASTGIDLLKKAYTKSVDKHTSALTRLLHTNPHRNRYGRDLWLDTHALEDEMRRDFQNAIEKFAQAIGIEVPNQDLYPGSQL